MLAIPLISKPFQLLTQYLSISNNQSQSLLQLAVCVNKSNVTICSKMSTKRDFTLIISDAPTALSVVL